jgi:hypothetical protein
MAVAISHNWLSIFSLIRGIEYVHLVVFIQDHTQILLLVSRVFGSHSGLSQIMCR